jgi:hypothetical protein
VHSPRVAASVHINRKGVAAAAAALAAAGLELALFQLRLMFSIDSA